MDIKEILNIWPTTAYSDVSVGDRVLAIWYPDKQWFLGTVQEDSEGFFITSDSAIGYLNDADHIIMVEKNTDSDATSPRR